MELTKIKGINEKREADFIKMGITNTGELVKFFPRSYLDMREKQPLKYAYHNDIVLTSGKVVSTPVNRFVATRRGFVKIICEQEGLIFSVLWFNQPYVLNKIVVGEEYLFYGRVQNRNGEISLINPSFEIADKVYRLQGIVPQYQCKGNLTQKVIRDACRLSVTIEKPKSIIPYQLQQKYSLGDLFSSYRIVHNPTSFEEKEKASNRIAIEEYFALISAFKLIKGDRTQVRINKYDCSSKDLVEFIATRFPFEFTDAQKKAVNEIYADMTGATVMNRLMQGDVGSGKTAVSLCSIFVAVKSGYQVVMLAPTEVLARQNYIAVKNAFPDYNVDLITGSNTAKEKKDIKDACKKGYINILIGTHAVLQDDLEFKRLSLCICDEQQRFGVAQRSSLLSKGVSPDVLVMSATPIPRTLSLIFYGDLDITTITDKPKERIPIQTNIVPSEKYLDMLKFIEKEIVEGRQAYFVCPKIDGDEEGTVMSAVELFEDLKLKMPNVSIGLLHGKMKDKEKNQVMQDFKDKKYGLLVSTTVIEVGVDVKDASVMVIYNAERFGLSQLHQLRGRVGRSNIKSYCFLMTKATTDIATQRLKIIKDNTDGFKISEFDYKLRGGGDFMGSRQSGKFITDLGFLYYDTESIFIAKKISDEVFSLGLCTDEIRYRAMEKYNKLKD
ncbi:MAG: ATP-dependent DNA helicase RecG, partial [Firmicutes bacterium]|nr:ATP-dependent DNA helicase RecG [Candidatus Caballimonas caccae]